MSIPELIQDPNVSIVDVRSKLEFMMGHAPGSVNIPLGSIPEKLQDLKSMSKPLVLCCASGARSGQALDYLAQAGLKNIHNAGPWRNATKK